MSKNRFGIVVFFFILSFIFLGIRIITIVFSADPRLKMDNSKHHSRGTIYDRNGKQLAISAVFYSLYARPKDLNPESKNKIASFLTSNLSFQARELSVIFTDKNFVWLRRKLSSEEIALVRNWIESLKSSGEIPKDELGVLPEQGRLYPFNAAAGVVGVVGIDNEGRLGLEYSLDSNLGKGQDVTATIDADVSEIVYEELKKGIMESQAEYGSVGIIDNEKKEVIALVSFPTFDPNDYKSITSYNMKFRAVSSIFEPGSVMKQFSAAFALENGIASPEKPFFSCQGFASVGDHTFTCESAHGNVNLERIIQKSCNVGMVQVADYFNRKAFYSFLRNFGFGEAADVPVGEKEGGILRPMEKWSVLSKYMVSVGQEIGVTTIQLLAASSVIASDGIFQTPLLIQRITDEAGKDVYEKEAKKRRLLSPQTAESLLSMMETVVSEDGTAIAAKIEGISIAGKTGTGQVARPISEGGGYYKDIFNAVFVGYVPSNKPKFTIVVVVNRPHGDKHTGGLVAAPVFANILRRMISSTSYFADRF
jgi:cell division protein FtsI/penicillin-binding protein 2